MRKARIRSKMAFSRSIVIIIELERMFLSMRQHGIRNGLEAGYVRILKWKTVEGGALAMAIVKTMLLTVSSVALFIDGILILVDEVYGGQEKRLIFFFMRKVDWTLNCAFALRVVS